MHPQLRAQNIDAFSKIACVALDIEDRSRLSTSGSGIFEEPTEIGYPSDFFFRNHLSHVVSRGGFIDAIRMYIRRQDSGSRTINMGISFILLIVIAMVPIITGNFGQRVVGKRSSADNDIANVDYSDYSAKYDDYPVS